MLNLKKTQHCNLCEHQKRNFDLGIHCSLTNKIPDFNKTCNKIKLEEKLKKEIERINIQYRKLNKNKFDVFIGIIFFPFIGFGILCFDFLFYKKYYEPYYSASLSSAGFAFMVVLFVIGIIFIAKGTGPLFNHKRQKNITEKEKENLDKICRLYGIKYEIEYLKNKNPFERNLYVKEIALKKLL